MGRGRRGVVALCVWPCVVWWPSRDLIRVGLYEVRSELWLAGCGAKAVEGGVIRLWGV